jgi:hypothetical protein
MPSANSVPAGFCRLRQPPEASRASLASPQGTAASTSSGSVHIEIHGSNVFEVADAAFS